VTVRLIFETELCVPEEEIAEVSEAVTGCPE
jgi:hypothetical protein